MDFVSWENVKVFGVGSGMSAQCESVGIVPSTVPAAREGGNDVRELHCKA